MDLKFAETFFHQAWAWSAAATLAVQGVWRKLTKKPDEPIFSEKLLNLSHALHKIILDTLMLPHDYKLERSKRDLEREQIDNTRDLERERLWTNSVAQKLERKRMESTWALQECLDHDFARALRQPAPDPDQLLIDYPLDTRQIN